MATVNNTVILLISSFSSFVVLPYLNYLIEAAGQGSGRLSDKGAPSSIDHLHLTTVLHLCADQLPSTLRWIALGNKVGKKKREWEKKDRRMGWR